MLHFSVSMFSVLVLVTLSATTVRFTAFMVQARRKGTGTTAGRFVDSRSVLSSKRAHTLTCNKSQVLKPK